MRMKKIFTFAAAALCYIATQAQTNPTPQTLPYSQNFSSLAHSSTTYPAGWQGWLLNASPGTSFNTATPSGDRALVANSSASINTGNVHNYDSKIGFLNTGSLDLSLVLAVNTINRSNVTVWYDIMTIRNPYNGTSETRINEVVLQYRVGTTGGFTTITGNEYQNNTTTQNGSGVTTPQNLQNKMVILPSACDNQSVVQIRWVSRQISGSGARPSFAVDSITVDTSTKPILSVKKNMDALEGATPTAGTFSFTFNPAQTASTTFDYAITGTATFGTDYTIALSGGATPATLTAATGTITVPASASSVIATVTPVNDAINEGSETIIIKLSNPAAPFVIGDTTATMSLLDDEATPIHNIQGSGNAATAGNYTVEGIVTGVYPTLSPAGFYMQEEDADADANSNTSEGIFVVTSGSVAPGDKVRVTGTALEGAAAPSYQQAVLNNTTVAVVNSGNPLPTATVVNLPVSAVSDYEKYECMLVRFPDTLTVTDNYNLGRYGEINLSKGGIVYQPTQLVDPNDATASGTTASGASNVAAINALIDSNARRTIMMDDGKGNMTVLPFADATDHTLRLGSTIHNVTGIMGFAFSAYRIQPVPHATPAFNYAQRPTTVPSVGANANVKIASFNVLNYFNGDGTGGGFPTSRGAHSPAEFTRQRNKIINALAAMDADVVGLIELENDGTGTNSALQDLVNGLNAQMGAGTYAFVNDGANSQAYCTDEIRCAIIYKPAKVDTMGAAMISADPVFNRPPLAQTFELVSNMQKFNFIINHFKSKSCGGSTGADADQSDGQSCYNNTRKKQAGALVKYIADTIVPRSGSGMVLTVGDYNAYFEEDPLDTMRAAGYTVLGTPASYSYLFFGQVGSLDNAVVNDSLKNKVTGIAKWNINSVEPPYLDYNDSVNDGGSDFLNQWGNYYTNAPFRSSDHDPILIGLELRLPSIHVASVGMNAGYLIYPNPATSVVYIENKTGEATIWQLTNTMGQLVASGNTGTSRISQVDIQNLNTGVYMLQLATADGKVSIARVVKQ